MSSRNSWQGKSVLSQRKWRFQSSTSWFELEFANSSSVHIIYTYVLSDMYILEIYISDINSQLKVIPTRQAIVKRHNSQAHC